jgi:hypothetical protein
MSKVLESYSRRAAIAAVLVIATIAAHAQLIVSDTFNVFGSGTGFALNAGVNTGINPPPTRLSGIGAPNLRYMPTSTKAETAFSIAANKLRVASAANPGRFVLSANGTSSFDFAGVLGSSTATPHAPTVYELKIRMANSSAGLQRFSFGLGTAEGDVTTWDFGIQVYRTALTDNFYTLGKRVDSLSAGLSTDVNRFVTNTPPGTYGSEIEFLMRVTDAGAESTSFNSRVQVSMDGGINWFYDTFTDSDLPFGWRFDGSGRHIIWDVAPDAGPVTYDDFSVVRLPITALPIAPHEATPNPGIQPLLSTTVSNALPGGLNVVFYGREAPRPYPGPDFAIAVLPDTQNYAREAPDLASKDMWISQTEWIITNRVPHNIAYVIHLGDIVQSGDIKNGNPNLAEWRNATNAMYRLENPVRAIREFGIPYGLTVGNHDQEPIDDPDGTTTFFNEYFGVSRFEGRPYYGGNFGSNNDSHFDLFSAGGLDFIAIYFENERYGSAIMNWANAVLATNQHRRIIAVTHHMGSAATPSGFSAQGSAIYNGLRNNTNLFLLLGGHISGEGSRQDTYQGRTIRTFISDYQGRPNGGNGWMRLMYFSPSNNTVTIQTYSPWLNKYETDANSEMYFSYNMQPGGPGSPGTPWQALGTNTAVEPGSVSSLKWRDLIPGRTYEWYASVTDTNGNTTTTPRWHFTATANASPVVSNLSLTIPGNELVAFSLIASDANRDDFTFRPTLPGHGLLSNIDTNKGTMTYLPARNFRGLDFFTFSVHDGLASSPNGTVLFNVVPPPDTNANSLADSWEAIFGVSDPEGDDDDDGRSNWTEYVAGTNPTNAASVLKLLSAAPESNGHFTITWASVGGTRYRVQYRDGHPGAAAGETFSDVLRTITQEMDPATPGQPSTQSWTDTFIQTGTPTNGRYYRIQVVQ